MEKFKSAWLMKNIDALFELLSDDVEYWETPFQRMGKDYALRKEWEAILPLKNMSLEYDIFVADPKHNRYGVKWQFSHTGGASAGTYLIQLNNNGKCNYFFHSSQGKEGPLN